MKRSRQVTLLLSGALATLVVGPACRRRPPPPPPQTMIERGEHRADQDQVNNSYVPGYGYYQSYYHRWYPYPFNWFVPDWGYYYGGDWHNRPFSGYAPMSSRPIFSSSSWFGGGGGRSFFSSSSSPGSGFAGSSVSRGGFGSTGHGGGGE
jgi:hypothetical protein